MMSVEAVVDDVLRVSFVEVDLQQVGLATLAVVLVVAVGAATPVLAAVFNFAHQWRRC